MASGGLDEGNCLRKITMSKRSRLCGIAIKQNSGKTEHKLCQSTTDSKTCCTAISAALIVYVKLIYTNGEELKI